MKDDRAIADPSRGTWPLLMDLNTAAAYTGLPYWTCRGLVIDGLIPRVVLPGKGGRPQLRIWTHRDDWEAFLRARRERNIEPSIDASAVTVALNRSEKARRKGG